MCESTITRDDLYYLKILLENNNIDKEFIKKLDKILSKHLEID